MTSEREEPEMREITTVPVTLSDGSSVLAEVTLGDAEVEVADGLRTMSDFTVAVGAIAKDLVEPLRALHSSSLELTFGLALSLQTGKLTALLVGGGANASVGVTVRWERAEGRSTTREDEP
jgi:hypothetical protein